jgi:hypothetical protein
MNNPSLGIEKRESFLGSLRKVANLNQPPFRCVSFASGLPKFHNFIVADAAKQSSLNKKLRGTT